MVYIYLDLDTQIIQITHTHTYINHIYFIGNTNYVKKTTFIFSRNLLDFNFIINNKKMAQINY